MKTGGEYIHEAFKVVGIEHAFGIPGRGTLPLDLAIRQGDEIEYVLARHETAVPYMAWGYYEASGRPAATITVPGPGDTNAANGLRNALMDRVPLVHVARDTAPELRGTGTLHEIDPRTYDHVVKENVDITHPGDVAPKVDRAIESALSPPLGPARIGTPFLGDEIGDPTPAIRPRGGAADNGSAYDEAIELLEAAERPVVYVGVGAKRAEHGIEAVASLVEALDAPVISSYKGKGVFPETDPRYAGTTGAQLPAGARTMLERADVVLGLGTDMGGPTTRDGLFSMGESLIHVTTDATVIDRLYDASVAIIDDVDTACRTFTDALSGTRTTRWRGGELGTAIREEYESFVESEGEFDERSPAPTPAVVRTFNERLPEDAIVVADIAEFRTWAMQLIEATSPESFIATGAWTSMGVGLPGAIGATFAAPDRPVVCLTGDGGFFQSMEELHTAVEYDLDLVVVVFNNSHLAMINTTPGLPDGTQFGWDSPDFAKLGAGFGCETMHANTPAGAGDALERALETPGPVLLEVEVDGNEPSSMDAWSYESSIDLP